VEVIAPFAPKKDKATTIQQERGLARGENVGIRISTVCESADCMSREGQRAQLKLQNCCASSLDWSPPNAAFWMKTNSKAGAIEDAYWKLLVSSDHFQMLLCCY
jgi:hypothetical protein